MPRQKPVLAHARWNPEPEKATPKLRKSMMFISAGQDRKLPPSHLESTEATGLARSFILHMLAEVRRSPIEQEQKASALAPASRPCRAWENNRPEH